MVKLAKKKKKKEKRKTVGCGGGGNARILNSFTFFVLSEFSEIVNDIIPSFQKIPCGQGPPKEHP